MSSIPELARELREALERRGITDPRVLDAIEETRRDLFVPESLQYAAYEDDALPIGEGQTISQPYIVALMTQELRLEGDETVLEIGTGSGYQAAILARLARRVVTIERLERLSERARLVLSELAVTNVEFLVGDGTLGNPERGPYDRVIVTASAPAIPEPLYQQLKPGGLIVAPVGDESSQELVVLEKTPAGPRFTPLCGCRFVKLIGKAGWAPAE
ncbi:MAG TPA: protein-L-isoaspartate(D-aspartate) O-methyltransferase [Planctomycetaceae bacterium]|nr:protein-L-isoaspartate(D-aspartate) O-methyltransferase [Planctomycetaceae bacterium]